uniref:F-box domain-containing protein n=1 Tax=Steinernema glaseri TaxID=37863 RepID=A0A1I8AHX3_9BILA
MPFLGKDWRAPGDVWIRNESGWQQVKLVQLSAWPSLESPTSAGIFSLDERLRRHSSSISLSSSDEPGTPRLSESSAEDSGSSSDYEEWIPHCFVKTSKSKEFVGCTSMSEAFHRLDMARAVVDVRRFNYVCKVLQIIVQEKLVSVSATARKHVLAIIRAIVFNSIENDSHVSVARELVNSFGSGLDGHVCGSPTLVSRQLDTVGTLLEMISVRPPKVLAESVEESTTFLDLPREVLTQILRRLPDHVSLLESAKAHEALDRLVEGEGRIWSTLCDFHFSPELIEKHRKPGMEWRHVFFELKKFYGLREVYADLIHICCHCKALFWKDHGHPCLSREAPSVRVTPQQFVDMLLLL